MQMKNMATTNN